MKTQRVALYFTHNGHEFSMTKEIESNSNNFKIAINEMIDEISKHYETWEFKSMFGFTVEKKEGVI